MSNHDIRPQPYEESAILHHLFRATSLRIVACAVVLGAMIAPAPSAAQATKAQTQAAEAAAKTAIKNAQRSYMRQNMKYKPSPPNYMGICLTSIGTKLPSTTAKTFCAEEVGALHS